MIFLDFRGMNYKGEELNTFNDSSPQGIKINQITWNWTVHWKQIGPDFMSTSSANSEPDPIH